MEAVLEGESFELWPENIEPLRLFMAMGSQWRVGGAGHPTGLDYAGVRAGLAMMRVRVTPELFEDFRACERAAVAAFLEGR